MPFQQALRAVRRDAWKHRPPAGELGSAGTAQMKDVVADRSHDTELGTGTLDFRRLLAAVPDIDRKPCYIEQEGATDPLASAKQDYEFLKKLEF